MHATRRFLVLAGLLAALSVGALLVPGCDSGGAYCALLDNDYDCRRAGGAWDYEDEYCDCSSEPTP